MTEYAHPESLVSTEWVAEHGSDANVRLVEVDVDTGAYEQGHIAGAVGWNWQSQLQQPVRRDLASKEEIEQLLGGSGIGNDTTVVLYGDNNNWFAAWAFWQLKYYGHSDVRIMNGGRAKWEAEGRPLTTDVPSHPAATYTASEGDQSIRAYRDQVLARVNEGECGLGGRPLTGGVQRRTAGARQPAAGRLAAGRTHPRRRQYPLGPGRG